MKKILFQGDSITDADRIRETDDLGRGYPLQVAARLGFAHPGEYELCNRGVSGDRIVDVYARIKKDIVNLKPDVMSLLIGVNDVWHEFGAENGVSAEKFEKIYGMLIEEIKAALPNIRIILLGAYVCRGTGTTETEEKWAKFSAEVALRAEAAKRTAEKYNMEYIPLQPLFDRAEKAMPPEYWTKDGVHPTVYGHAIIAEELINAIENM